MANLIGNQAPEIVGLDWGSLAKNVFMPTRAAKILTSAAKPSWGKQAAKLIQAPGTRAPTPKNVFGVNIDKVYSNLLSLVNANGNKVTGGAWSNVTAPLRQNEVLWGKIQAECGELVQNKFKTNSKQQ